MKLIYGFFLQLVCVRVLSADECNYTVIPTQGYISWFMRFQPPWGTSRSLVCPLLPSLLRPSGSASYRGLSLAPGQGHCIITAQLRGRLTHNRSQMIKNSSRIHCNIKHLQKTIRGLRAMERLRCGFLFSACRVVAKAVLFWKKKINK